MATDGDGVDISEAEARAAIAIPKFIPDDLTWSAEPNKSLTMVFSAGVLDENGATVQGLTVDLSFRTPARVDDCRYSFTLFTFRPTGKKRAYQLAVMPEHLRGHVDARGEIRGPHQHIGNLVEPERMPHLGCKNHEQWFRIFLDRANIKHSGRYFGPFEGGLFNGM